MIWARPSIVVVSVPVEILHAQSVIIYCCGHYLLSLYAKEQLGHLAKHLRLRNCRKKEKLILHWKGTHIPNQV